MTSPYVFSAAQNIDPATILAGADNIITEAPFNGTLADASFTPEADITGDAANNRVFTIVNKGADGNGATVMATLAYLAGVNSTDFNETPFTLSVVAGATAFVQGDIIACVEEVNGAGLVNPGGRIALGLRRTYA